MLEADCPGLLVELGRSEEALERAARLAAAAEASGDTLRAVLGARGRARDPPRPRRARGRDRHRRLARRDSAGTPRADVTVEVLAAAAAARLAAAEPEQARALLAELEQTPGARRRPYYSRQLAAMLRTALAAGDPGSPSSLTDGLEPLFPLREHALCAARAQLAEHAGDHAGAATLYAEAAARWQEFGNVPEHAYALLGQGRCLLALGRPRRRATAPPGGGAVRVDGLPPRPRRDRSAPPASDRAG